MKKIATVAVSCLFAAAFCAAQTQGSNSGFRQEGIASWYGVEFEGRPTASGELFDPDQFTAAHPDLPFGTVLIVTNAVNGEKVMVRVNDRGPFVKSRIIDVSRAAAEQLNMLETGTAQVIVELAPRNAVAGSSSGGTNSSDRQASAASTAGLPEPQADAIAPVTASAPESAPPAAQPEESPGTAPASAAPAPGTPNSPGGSQAAAALPSNPAAPSYTPQQPALAQTTSAPASQSPARTPAQTSAAQAAARVPAQTPATQAAARVPAQTSTAQTGTGAPAAQTSRLPAQTSTVQPRQTTAAPQTLPSSSSARPQPGSVPVASFQPIPTTTRPPAVTPSSTPLMPSSARAPAVPSTPPTAAQPQRNLPVYPSAEISGGPFVSGRYYRLQVGSYKVAKNAVDVFDRLSSAGLNPQWEPYGDLYRVVISNVRAEDINTIAVRLGNAGFREAIAREER
ncbi:MAG: septal ring lytic transglycosylase RlpA family protein [Spirochaetaceae bacterium]|nr:septal ring lytic transglycosylase RlpA family protein [Spirochaetaceae bacterium]